MNFLFFKNFFIFFEFSEFEINLFDFSLTQVTSQHVERPIVRLIAIVDRHLRRGGTWHNSIRM